MYSCVTFFIARSGPTSVFVPEGLQPIALSLPTFSITD